MIELNTKPWCNCHTTGKWLRQDGYTLDGPTGLWVHARCRKPSRMNYERNVLGLTQIPQQRKNVDIYDMERQDDLRKMAKVEIDTELSWEDEEEDEYSY